MPLEQPQVLAAAAETLGSQLLAQVRHFARALRQRLDGLERKFLTHLNKRGYDPKHRKALAAITPMAAARVLLDGRPLADFFEQVDYNGRRLAKLALPPARILGELDEAGWLVDAALGHAERRQAADFAWVREQLQFCVVLTLNNAFYAVREAETEALYGLFRAELEARGHAEMLERFLAILARFCHADAGRLFLLDRKRSTWVAVAGLGGPAEAPSSAALERKLSRPRHLGRGELVLDGQWGGRYASCWSVPLLDEGRIEGVIQLGFRKAYEWLPRELELLATAAERIRQASEKARLAEELAAREEQVRRLAAALVHVEEAERQRISRELHDEAGQSLLWLRLQLEMLEQRAPEELKPGLTEARQTVERTITEVRRLVADLSPAVLEHLGLPAALRRLLGRLQRLYPIEVKLHLNRTGTLPKGLQRVVYRLVQECCQNAGRHSSAAHLNISLTSADRVLRLNVQDDGVGFKVEQALARRNCHGLEGMRERVLLLGGRFAIRSRPGEGSEIAVELPESNPSHLNGKVDTDNAKDPHPAGG